MRSNFYTHLRFVGSKNNGKKIENMPLLVSRHLVPELFGNLDWSYGCTYRWEEASWGHYCGFHLGAFYHANEMPLKRRLPLPILGKMHLHFGHQKGDHLVSDFEEHVWHLAQSREETGISCLPGRRKLLASLNIIEKTICIEGISTLSILEQLIFRCWIQMSNYQALSNSLTLKK
jgi:hypothetical protein